MDGRMDGRGTAGGARGLRRRDVMYDTAAAAGALHIRTVAAPLLTLLTTSSTSPAGAPAPHYQAASSSPPLSRSLAITLTATRYHSVVCRLLVPVHCTIRTSASFHLYHVTSACHTPLPHYSVGRWTPSCTPPVATRSVTLRRHSSFTSRHALPLLASPLLPLACRHQPALLVHQCQSCSQRPAVVHPLSSCPALISATCPPVVLLCVVCSPPLPLPSPCTLLRYCQSVRAVTWW